MRTAIILSALLLTACGSRQHSVRESAELDFNKQVCLKDSLEAYMRIDSRTEIDSLSVSVCLDSMQRPTRVRVKAHGVKRRDSIATQVAETRCSQSADSIKIRRYGELQERKSSGTHRYILYIALTLLLITLWNRR